MKITPRKIKLISGNISLHKLIKLNISSNTLYLLSFLGKEKYQFIIENSSNNGKTDRILLFRIRREGNKSLTFSPKKGYVMPGESKTINVFLVDESIEYTKLLVKLVALPNAEYVQEDYERSWSLAESISGEVKKIIEIYSEDYEEHHHLHDPNDPSSPGMYSMVSDTSIFSMYPSNHTPRQEEIEGSSSHISEVDRSPMSASTSLFSSSFIDYDSTVMPGIVLSNNIQGKGKEPPRPLLVPSFAPSTSSIAFSAGQTLDSTPSLPNMQSIIQVLQALQSQVVTLTEKLQGQPTNTTNNTQLLSLQSEKQVENEEIYQRKPLQTEETNGLYPSHRLKDIEYEEEYVNNSQNITNNDIHYDLQDNLQLFLSQHSHLIPYSSSKHQISSLEPFQSMKLEIFGEEMTVKHCKQCLEYSILSCIQQKQHIININIQQCQLISIKQWLETLFYPLETSSTSVETLPDPLKPLLYPVETHDNPSKPLESTINPPSNTQILSSQDKELISLRLHYLHQHVFELTIQYCQLLTIDLPCLSMFSQLIHLDLSHNQLKTWSIDHNYTFPHLLSLNLSYNHLQSIDGIDNLLSLQTLELHHNRFNKLKHVLFVLLPLTYTLQYITIYSNPFCTQEMNYIEDIMIALPGLKTLDHISIDVLRYNSHQLNSWTQKTKKNMKNYGKIQQSKEDLPDLSIVSQELHGTTSNEYSTNPTIIMKIKRTLQLKAYQLHRDRWLAKHGKYTQPPRTKNISSSSGQQRSLSSSRTLDKSYLYPTHSSVLRYAEEEDSLSQNMSSNQPMHRSLNRSNNQSSYFSPSSSIRQEIRDRRQYQRQQHEEQEVEEYSQQEGLGTNVPQRRPMDISPARETMSKPTPQNSSGGILPTQSMESIRSSSSSKVASSGGQSRYLTSQTASSKQRRKSYLERNLLVSHWTSHSHDQQQEEEELEQNIQGRKPFSSQELYPEYQENPPNVNNTTICSQPTTPSSRYNNNQSTLLQPTSSIKQRRKSFGILPSTNEQEVEETAYVNSATMWKSPSRDYWSDGEVEGTQWKARRRNTFRGQAAKVLSRSHYEEMQEEERYGIYHPRYRVPKPHFGFSKPFLYRDHPHLK